MFPQYPIRAITNGVHAVSWTAPSFQKLFDSHVPEWRNDNLYLRYAIGIPLEEIRHAHLTAKRDLLQEVNSRHSVQLSESILTIGFARRAATYKRADLLFSDIEWLRRIANQVGPMQISMQARPIRVMKEGKLSFVMSFRPQLRWAPIRSRSFISRTTILLWLA